MPKFTQELEELVANNVITQDVADNIRSYYDRPAPPGTQVNPTAPTASRASGNRIVIAFGIIGALLVGMGIVLIIAHNWDTLPNAGKLAIGFAPMLVCHALAGILVFKQSTSHAWREGVGVTLVFAVAVSIGVVSQVYNTGGEFSRFLLAWAVLVLPVIYILRSSMASLLFWMIITWYAVDVGFGIFRDNEDPIYFWLLALAALPFYILMIRNRPDSNSISFHSWVIGASVTTVMGLGDYYKSGADLMVCAYLTLFSVYLLIGQLPFFANRRTISNAWLVGGSAGTIFLVLAMTFEWPDLGDKSAGWWNSAPMFIWIFLFVVASALLYIVGNRVGFKNVLSKSYTFLIFLVLFVIGMSNPGLSQLLSNLLLLTLGVYTIREGALANKLWKMNYGLLIISVLIACRFFDTDLSFVIRGLLFVAIGVGFFAMNMYMVRKRKATA